MLTQVDLVPLQQTPVQQSVVSLSRPGMSAGTNSHSQLAR